MLRETGMPTTSDIKAYIKMCDTLCEGVTEGVVEEEDGREEDHVDSL